MSNLFNINKELSELLEIIEENGGEVTEEQCELLAIKREELEVKVISYDQVLKFLDSQEKAAKAEIERIKKFVDQKEKVAEQLRKTLLEALLLFGTEQKNGVRVLEYGTVKLSTRKSSSIEVENTELLNDAFKKYEVSLTDLGPDQYNDIAEILINEGYNDFKSVVKPVKALIKTAIESGKEVPGARQDTKVNLKIS